MIICAGIESPSCGAWLPGRMTTARSCVADRPPGSVAVTVTVALPAATPTTTTVASDAVTVTTAMSELAAVYVSASPSGSLKFSATCTVTSPPWSKVSSPSEPTATGGWLPASTVTLIDCVAVAPSGSRAVTVTVALPAATPVIVTVLPATEAVATPASEVVAE